MDWMIWLAVTVICTIITIIAWRYAETLQAEETAETVRIIKGNPKKMWPIWVLNGLWLLPLLIFVSWVEKLAHPECTHFMSFNISYLVWILLFLFLPIVTTVMLSQKLLEAKKALKTGFLPPLDSIYTFDTKAYSIKLRRTKNKLFFILYISPLFLIGMCSGSFYIYQKFQFAAMDYQQQQRHLEKKCTVITSYPNGFRE